MVKHVILGKNWYPSETLFNRLQNSLSSTHKKINQFSDQNFKIPFSTHNITSPQKHHTLTGYFTSRFKLMLNFTRHWRAIWVLWQVFMSWDIIQLNSIGQQQLYWTFYVQSIKASSKISTDLDNLYTIIESPWLIDFRNSRFDLNFWRYVMQCSTA